MRRRLRSPPRLHATRDAPRGKICRSVWPFIPNPLLFLPLFILSLVIPLSYIRNILILFIGFSSFLFSDVKLISFPEKFRLHGLNKRTKLRFDRARIFVLFRTEFWSNYSNLISNFQSLRCILVFSFDGQATTEGYFLGTGTVG